MQFTQSQQSAIDAFNAFLAGREQVFMLKGAAGTGKTTIVAELLNILRMQHHEVRLMAPTGRAAFVLSDKTGLPAHTIHKSIYSFEDLKSSKSGEEGDDEDAVLHTKYGLRSCNDPADTIYIVDESSLISDIFSENEAFSFGSGKLLSDLFTFVHGRKIVFVGDYAQLPPIGMSFSPALDAEYIAQNFGCKVREVMLREVIRQTSNSTILNNATRIRQCIEDKRFIEFKLAQGEDSQPEDDDLLTPYYSLSASKPFENAIVVAYSNRQALKYNIAIRSHYFGNSAPRLQQGDSLLIARNNYAYDIELFNGSIVQVISCAENDNEVEIRPVRVKLGKDNIETVNLSFRKVRIATYLGDRRHELEVTILDNFLDDPAGSIGGMLARALIVDFNNRLPSNIKQSLTEIKRNIRKKIDLSHSQLLVWDAYRELLIKDPYYNALICKYGYAMTGHKAQGGEWDYVFVDMGRYGGTANEDFFRWTYTALTRASKKIWHYRSPDFNYISGMTVEQIQASKNIKVSTYSTDSDFCKSRFARIKELCARQGIAVSENKSKAYQHIINFQSSCNEKAQFTLWYNAVGYSDKAPSSSASNNEFAGICRRILALSYAPSDVPFSAPQRPFAEKLVDFVKSQLAELDIRLLNITSEQYQDIFHLKTDGIAKLQFSYTGKGNYTHLKPISSLGADDQKLEKLRQLFI